MNFYGLMMHFSLLHIKKLFVLRIGALDRTCLLIQVLQMMKLLECYPKVLLKLNLGFG